MDDILGQLEASIQATIDGDTDFQTSLEGLSDEEKNQKITERKSEEINKELSTLKVGSEKATKAQELADNYKVRAEKAEKALKDKGGTPPAPSSDKKSTLSAEDALRLAKADIALEDVDEVVKYAGYRDISIADALKDATLQSIVKGRAEERASAAAAALRGGPRGVQKNTGKDVLQRARQGSDVSADDIDKLVDAEMEEKRGKKK